MNRLKKMDKFVFGRDNRMTRKHKIIALAGMTLLFVVPAISGWMRLSDGGDLVKDLSAYMKINPGESKQRQEMKQEYNLNQFLIQKDRKTQEVYRSNMDRLNRSLDRLSPATNNTMPGRQQ